MVLTRQKSNTLRGTTTKNKIVSDQATQAIKQIKRQKTNSSNVVLEESGKIIYYYF